MFPVPKTLLLLFRQLIFEFESLEAIYLGGSSNSCVEYFPSVHAIRYTSSHYPQLIRKLKVHGSLSQNDICLKDFAIEYSNSIFNALWLDAIHITMTLILTPCST